MSEILINVPRIGTNDDYVTIGEWLVESGTKVVQGQEFVSLETTKETEEVAAEADGYIFYKLQSGEDAKVGELLAVLSSDANYTFAQETSISSNLNITEKAKRLIEKYNIDISKLPAEGIIREKDVMKLVNTSEKVVRSKANDVVIVSGGGFAKMIIDLLRMNKAYNIHGITDATLEKGSNTLGVEVIGTDDELDGLRNEGYMTAVNAIGSIASDNTSKTFFLRKKIFEMLKEKGFFLPTLIHPTASVATSAQLGEGTVVMEQAVIGSSAIVGDDCIINTGAIVSHDCVIGNHARISPGAVLAGNVEIGENSLIGMGVTIYIGAKIGKNVIIANGKDVFGNVPDNTVIK